MAPQKGAVGRQSLHRPPAPESPPWGGARPGRRWCSLPPNRGGSRTCSSHTPCSPPPPHLITCCIFNRMLNGTADPSTPAPPPPPPPPPPPGPPLRAAVWGWRRRGAWVPVERPGAGSAAQLIPPPPPLLPCSRGRVSGFCLVTREVPQTYAGAMSKWQKRSFGVGLMSPRRKRERSQYRPESSAASLTDGLVRVFQQQGGEGRGKVPLESWIPKLLVSPRES